MKKNSAAKVESRKEWTAPKLKKVGIDELTAFDTHTGRDGTGKS